MNRDVCAFFLLTRQRCDKAGWRYTRSWCYAKMRIVLMRIVASLHSQDAVSFVVTSSIFLSMGFFFELRMLTIPYSIILLVKALYVFLHLSFIRKVAMSIQCADAG